MQDKHKEKTCYFCGQAATTREHVPPRALFPEQAILRKNLITVPSCDKHNSKKSGDDEYFCNVMRTSINSNKIPEKAMLGSIARSVYRNPKIYDELFQNEFPISVWDGASYQESRVYDVNMEHMNNILKHISKAIFYHEMNSISQYEYVGFNFLSECIEQKEQVEAMLKLWTMLPYKGENPDIFKYKICLTEKAYFLLLCIYEGNLLMITSECVNYGGNR